MFLGQVTGRARTLRRAHLTVCYHSGGGVTDTVTLLLPRGTGVTAVTAMGLKKKRGLKCRAVTPSPS